MTDDKPNTTPSKAMGLDRADLAEAAAAPATVGVFWKFRWAVGEFVRDPFGQRGYVDTAALDRGGSIYLVRYEGDKCTWWAEHVLTEDLPS